MASENCVLKGTINGHSNQTTVYYELLKEVLYLRGV